MGEQQRLLLLELVSLVIFNGDGPLAEAGLLLHSGSLVEAEAVSGAHLGASLAIFELLLALEVKGLPCDGLEGDQTLRPLFLDRFEKWVA